MVQFGFWLPIFGGWLRNVEDEGMPPTFEYALDVARHAEEWGYSTTLIAELNLNDIKGVDEPVLEAWTADELVLYESVLRPPLPRPRYVPIERYPLRPSG